MVGKNINVKQAGRVVLLKLRVVKSAVVKVWDVKLLWGLKFSRLEYYKDRVTPLKMAFGCRNMSG
jgi:hypothetical protein